VADAAALLGPLTGVDPRDPATADSTGHRRSDYRSFLDPAGLDGARIGVWRAEGATGYSPEADAILEDALQAMRDAGAVVVDPADILGQTEVFEPEFTVLLYEFKADLNAYLADLESSPVRTLEEVIDFNRRHARVELQWFGQEIMEIAQTFGPLTERAYRDALRASGPVMRAAIDKTIDDNRLDAIVTVQGAPAWTTDLVNGDHFLGNDSTPAAVAGYPHIVVPGGYAHRELPVGISFIGKAWTEGPLIRLAYAFEQATRVRHAPRYLRTLGTEDYVARAPLR
jgi:amidase